MKRELRHMTEMRDLRLIFCGDSLVNGTFDSEMLGWSGRLARKTAETIQNITYYNLGVRHETSVDLRSRLSAELDVRLQGEFEKRIIISIGHNDVMLANGQLRVTEKDTCKALDAILKETTARSPVLVVSPPPSNDPEHIDRTFHISEIMAEKCRKLNIPFVPAHTFTAQSKTWARDLAMNDGRHPYNDAYADLAEWIYQTAQWSEFITPRHP